MPVSNGQPQFGFGGSGFPGSKLISVAEILRGAVHGRLSAMSLPFSGKLGHGQVWHTGANGRGLWTAPLSTPLTTPGPPGCPVYSGGKEAGNGKANFQTLLWIY